MRIIEAVLFNNELELLEARLHEGDGVVDHWIILESTTTFTGNPKPLHFRGNRDRFSAFTDRISSSVVYTPYTITPWVREAMTRDALRAALYGYGPDDDDLVVLSDGDELTRRSAWPEIVERTEGRHCVSLHKPTWYYTLTWQLPDAGPAYSSYRSKGARAESLLLGAPISSWADDLSFPVVVDSGWHLSCLGGPARLLEKIQSFSHQEINTPEWATYENCRRLIQDGVDCAPERNATLTHTDPAGPDWLITEGVAKYPWLLTGEDPCIPQS